MNRATPDDIFLGREREMARLTAALDDAIAGRGRLIMLVGEPGIGKTRTAEELASVARQRGVGVLWGRCPEERGAPPYWPWVQVITAHVDAVSADALRTHLGRSAAVLAEIVATITDKLPGLEHAPVIEDPESARFRLFDAITSFLKRASLAIPFVIVLDNLHWTDGSSLRLLGFATHELADSRVLIVGTYRDTDVSRDHPLFKTLGDLTRERLFHRVLLRGLSAADTGRMVQAASDLQPPESFVAQLHEQTEGNPLFVGEVVRLLAQEGMLTPERLADLEAWRFRLPEGVREVIGRRLDQLSGQCNEALKIAAVTGREFHLGLLMRLLKDVSEEQVFGLVDEAQKAHIIEEKPDAPGRFQFTHALIQQTLASEMSVTRRVRLHAETAQALEALYGPDADEHAAELAHHYAEAETVMGTEKLIRYARLAGERALVAYAYEDALAHFETALAAKKGRSMDGETAALLFGLARARMGDLERGNVHEAIATAAPAFDHYVATGDTARALAIAEYPFSQQFGFPGSWNLLLARALDLVPPDSTKLAGLLISYASSLVKELGDLDGARKALNRALGIAHREHHKTLEVRALLGMSGDCGMDLRWPEANQFDSKAIEVARDEGLSEIVAASLSGVMPVISRLVTGDLKGARDRERDLPAAAEGHFRRRYNTAAMGVVHALVARAVGDWTRARRSTETGLRVSPHDVRLLASRILPEYEVGNFDEGEVYVTRMVETMRTAPRGPNLEHSLTSSTVAMADYIRGEAKWSEAASEAANVVLTSKHALRFALQDARVGLALVSVLRGDRESAGEQLRALQGYPHVMLSNMTCSLGRVLGLLAQAIGDTDRASQYFEDTLVFCRKAGYSPEQAWTCHEHAAMLLSGARTVDARQAANARALLDEGAPIAEQLGMKPLAARLAGLREKLASVRGDRSGYPGGLTERQAEVLRLIADGKTNREIAEELVLSQRTVQRHVADIYLKIHARNRAEATAYALRELASLTRPPR